MAADFPETSTVHLSEVQQAAGRPQWPLTQADTCWRLTQHLSDGCDAETQRKGDSHSRGP